LSVITYLFFRYGFHAPDCRFGAPWQLDDEIRVDSKLNKGRVRLKICTPRNNHFINRHAAAPHVDCAANSNTDFTLISDPFGAGSYVASYSSKAEAPDSNIMMKIMMRSLTNPEHRTHRDLFRATANGMLGSVQVGATQAMFVLLKLKFIHSSRTTSTLNTLPRPEVTQRVVPVDVLLERIEREGKSASAVDISPNSSLGKRAIYSEVLKQQGPDSDLTMFALFSSYRVSIASKCKENEENDDMKDDNDNDDVDEHETIAIQDESSTITQLGKRKRPTKSRITWVTNPVLQMDGLFLHRSSSKNFVVNNYRFSQLTNSERVIIHCSPYIPFEPENDRSAFSLLLLHVPWPNGNESNIVPIGKSASEHLAFLKTSELLTPALLRFIDENVGIQKALDEQGVPKEGIDSAHMNDESNDGCIESNDEDGGFPEGENDESENDSTEIKAQFPQGTDDVVNLTEDQYHSGKDHIAHLMRLNSKKLFSENKFSIAQCQARKTDPHFICHCDNHNQMQIELAALVSSMNALQRETYLHIAESINKDTPEQLLMTISGEAGTGKSYIAQAIRLCTKLRFGKTNTHIGPFLAVAPTGTAAFNINGFTWQSALNKAKNDKGSVLKKISQDTADKLQGKLDGLKVVIIDEMSLVGLESLVDINRRLQAAQSDKVRAQQLFGGCTVILMGDFYQAN